LLLLRMLVAATLSGAAMPASAAIVARVDTSAQRMRVFVDGRLAHVWPVSTARSGYRTPAGHYRVQRTERMWHSRKYDMSPMPHAMFFRGGYAIHGTYSVRQLGRPASHGCVRLARANARALFQMVRPRGGTQVELSCPSLREHGSGRAVTPWCACQQAG
jgi:lipoprotein-anchoring transpeptidase ErfK/SrfK